MCIFNYKSEHKCNIMAIELIWYKKCLHLRDAYFYSNIEHIQDQYKSISGLWIMLQCYNLTIVQKIGIPVRA